MTASADEQLVPAEDHPTGTAWRSPGPRPAAELPPGYKPCTRDEQAAHMAALLEGIAGVVIGRPGRCA
ncbi:hypothetical protein [Streptomyces zinciresistens]|uniref:hypothetical protein n=1 Tax=Streptomyces zinciresistens TaxID=1073330 RepID=UPI0002D96814|nr:hypothetical protein [Streptomyces zinciresistens]